MTTIHSPSTAELFEHLEPAHRLAARLVDDIHRAAVKSPVLDGPERYDRLATRLHSAALSSDDLPPLLRRVQARGVTP